MPGQLLRKTVARALRLRCPRCGSGRLFAGLFTMHERCASCAMLFEREPGYFIGAMYINYAMTAVLSIGGFLLLDAYTGISVTAQIVLWGAFAVAFPLFFFRYARSLWLAVDYRISPEEPHLRVVRGRDT